LEDGTDREFRNVGIRQIEAGEIPTRTFTIVSCTLMETEEMGRACGAYGGGERCARGSGGRPERKRPLGRPRHRWEDNIKVDLEEVGGGCGDWMELAQDSVRWQALVSAVMNFRVP
jgi:hypothetical protein